jgi:nitrate reductase NapE component
MQLKKKQRKKLSKKEFEKERKKIVAFTFVVCIVGTYGFLIDVYTDVDNPLMPNFINLIFQREVIPDEEQMFIGDYYIINQSMSPVKIKTDDGKYRYTVAYDINKMKENKISGVFFYMIMCFLPLFIIGMAGERIKKINKRRIKDFFKKKKRMTILCSQK